MTNVGFSTMSLVPDAHRFEQLAPKSTGVSLARAGKRGGALFFASTLRAIAPLAAISAGMWVVGKVGRFFKDAVAGASDLEQSVGAIETVFKGSSGQMLDWSNSAATAVGLTANEYNTLGTLIGTQLKNGGTATDELAGKTNDLIGVGADLSSIFGGTTSKAVEALSSALKGERDPIEAYGVSLTQAKIDAEAAALGFEKVGGSLSTEANQAATLSLIMQQTADAHGNFARESDTLAHKQQVLNAMWENGKTKIGQALLPAVSGLASALIGVLGPSLDGAVKAINRVVDAFSGFGSAFAPVIDGMVAAFAPFVPQIVGALSQLVPAFAGVLPSLSPFSVILQGLLPILPQVIPHVLALGGGLYSLAVLVHGQFLPLAQRFGESFRGQFVLGLELVSAATHAFWSVFAAEALPQLQQLLPSLVELASAVLSAVAPNIAALVQVLVPVLTVAAQLVAAIAPVVAVLLAVAVPAVRALLPVASTVFAAVTAVVAAAMRVVRGVIEVATGVLAGDWGRVWHGLRDVLGGVWDAVSAVVRGALAIVVALVRAGLGIVRSTWSAAFAGLRSLFAKMTGGLADEVTTGTAKLVGFLSGLGRRARSALSDAGSWLASVGRNIVAGLLDGVKAFTKRLAGSFLSPVEGLADGLRSALGIHSPSRVLAEVGTSTGADVAEALSEVHYEAPQPLDESVIDHLRRLGVEHRSADAKTYDAAPDDLDAIASLWQALDRARLLSAV